MGYPSRFRTTGQLITKGTTGNRKVFKKTKCIQTPPAHFISHPVSFQTLVCVTVGQDLVQDVRVSKVIGPYSKELSHGDDFK
jgi:hypothetical protein